MAELPPDFWETVPACSICGRQDETLRDAAFPFVVSLVIVSFRRTFVGRWCKRHRNVYWFLSSLITSLVGWFGIPFGFIYTPLTMFKLARGGEQPVEHNQRLLQVLAGHKLRASDGEGAIRCLEEGLRLGDDEAARQRLRELYDDYRPSTYRESYARLWPLFVGILGAAAIGFAIGLLDYAITAGLTSILGEEANLFFVILSWMPLVAMLFLGGLALAQLVEWALRRCGCRQMALGVACAVVAALVALYGTQQGTAIGDFLQAMLAGEAFDGSLRDLIAAWLVLTVGGAVRLVDYVQYGGGPAAIYLVVFVVAAVYYVEISLRAARSTVRWHQALAAVQTRGEPSKVRALQPGWLAIVAVFFCITCSILSFPLGALIATGQDVMRLGQAMERVQQGGADEAVAELEVFVQENPDVVFGRNALAAAYVHRGEFDRAAEELEIAVDLAPDWGFSHAMLATTYFFLDQPDLMEQELQRAEELGADDAQTQLILGGVYDLLQEFDRARDCYLRVVELQPGDAIANLSLARVYAAQGKYGEALATCDRASELAPDLVDVPVARGYVHIRQEDLAGAEEAFAEAAALAPEDAGAHSAMSYLHFLRGETVEAQREAEEAVRLDPYDRDGHEGLAFACHAQGDLQRALAAAQEAVRLNPKDDTPHHILGLCYMDLGQADEAIEEFETFLDLYWDRAYVRDWKAQAEAYLTELR
jgi:superkiller protein 3